MDAGFGSTFRAYSIVNFNVNSLIEFDNHSISPARSLSEKSFFS
jgi:hypothetical protein